MWKFLSPRKLFCFQMPDRKWNEESSRAQGGLVLRYGSGGIAHWLPAIHKAFVQRWAVQMAVGNWCLVHCSGFPKGKFLKSQSRLQASFRTLDCVLLCECLGVVEGSASTASGQNLLPGLLSRSPLQVSLIRRSLLGAVDTFSYQLTSTHENLEERCDPVPLTPAETWVLVERCWEERPLSSGAFSRHLPEWWASSCTVFV